MGILLMRRAVCAVCVSAGLWDTTKGVQAGGGWWQVRRVSQGIANYLWAVSRSLGRSVSLLGGPCKVTASPGQATNLTSDNTSWACCGDGTTGRPNTCCGQPRRRSKTQTQQLIGLRLINPSSCSNPPQIKLTTMLTAKGRDLNLHYHAAGRAGWL